MRRKTEEGRWSGEDCQRGSCSGEKGDENASANRTQMDRGKGVKSGVPGAK
jgi:hypothetical protein